MKNDLIVPYEAAISKQDRAKKVGHVACVVWFTGLSGAGKSTLAHSVERKLFEIGCQTYVLDGDNFRKGVCSDLGFGESDRTENIRRAGEVAKLFVDAGTILLAAFISPLRTHRQFVRDLLPPDSFIEVYCNADIRVCEARDVKGFYRRARLGEIDTFTGVSSPYEAPENPELMIQTDKLEIEASVSQVMDFLHKRVLLRE
jgi:adenylylsulfate kinase